jgi:hypothetical protein
MASNWTATPSLTLTPTATQTSTPTVDPATIFPVDWAGEIDHEETLPDGRKVAIEKSTVEGKPSVKRVLQWDEGKKEWIAYVPIKSLLYVGEFVSLGYSPEITLSTTIPKVEIPLIDANGDEFPIGVCWIL